MSGESAKSGTRGGGRASKKNKKSTTQTNKNSRTPKKYVSQSAQVQKNILLSPSRGRTQKSCHADSGTPGNRQGKKAARSKITLKLTKQTSKTDGAKSRGCSNKRLGKATASSQMSGDRQSKMRYPF